MKYFDKQTNKDYEVVDLVITKTHTLFKTTAIGPDGRVLHLNAATRPDLKTSWLAASKKEAEEKTAAAKKLRHWEGIAEIEAAMNIREKNELAFARMMETGSSIYKALPGGDVEAMAKKYPAAAAYIELELGACSSSQLQWEAYTAELAAVNAGKIDPESALIQAKANFSKACEVWAKSN